MKQQEALFLSASEIASQVRTALGNTIIKKKTGLVVLKTDPANPTPSGYVPVQMTGQPETYNAPYNALRTPPEVLQTGVKVWLFVNEDGEWEVDDLFTKQTVLQSSNLYSAIMAPTIRAMRHADSFFTSGTIPPSRGGFSLTGLADGDLITASGVLGSIKHNLTATTDPTTSDNAAAGYSAGSRWLNVTSARVFTYISESAGLALWVELTLALPVTLENGGTEADLSAAADGEVVKAGSTLATIKHNLTATADPTTSDNAAAGWGVKSLWINVTASRVWQYIKEAAGVADWQELTTPYPVTMAHGGSGADLSSAVDGFVVKSGSTMAIRGFTVSTSAPTVNEDSADGYGLFSLYHHYDPGGGGENDLYWCSNATVGGAVWNKYALQNQYAIFSTVRGTTVQSVAATGNTFTASGAAVTLHRSDNTDYPTIELLRSRASSADPQSGDILGAFRARGYNASGTDADVQMVASETHSGTSRGARIEVRVVKNGTNTPIKVLTLEHTGRAVFSPDTSVAPANLTPAATPSTLANGDQWSDTTVMATGEQIGGMTHWHAGMIFTQTADGSAAASGSEVDMAGTGIGSLTIKANRWVAGSTIEWEMYGRLNTDNSTSSRALIISVKFGSTELVNQSISFTNNYSTANEANGRSFNARGRIKVRTGGSSGTAVASIWFQIDGLTARTTSGLLVSSLNFTTDTALTFPGKWTSYVSGDTAHAKDLIVNQLM